MHANNPRLSLLKVASICSLGLTLLACGGGGDSNRVDSITNKPGAGGGSSSVSNQRMIGVGSGNDFRQGEIGVGVGSDTLSAGGTTALTVNLVNSDYTLATDVTAVTFSSRCLAANEATLSENPVSTSTGQVSVTYTANGCSGTDDITAKAIIDGSVLEAKASITVETDTVSSIQFVDASPLQISLKGTGDSETASVRFQVKGSTGAPVKGSCVDFSLNTDVGGTTLVNSRCEASDAPDAKRAKTDSEGYATITVQAGNIATPVTVTARHMDTGLSTQSRGLYISTGVPDQKSMSLSASVKNPNAWNYDGETVTFTIRLADAFNNPPADGTSVSFTTSGGSISPSCTTQGGACSVIWTSQSPRPSSAGQIGHVRVLAHTTGNESFNDVNGNGWYDFDIDGFASNNPACNQNVPPASAELGQVACDDLGEAFLDRNHNREFDTNEWFVDFDKNGERNEADGLYNGVLCREADALEGKCTRSGVTIRRDYLIIMSSNQPHMVNGRLEGQPATLPASGGSFSALLADQHRNPLPAETSVVIDFSNAENVKVSPAEVIIPSTHSPQYLNAIVSPDGNEPPSGFLQIIITTPDGLVTTSAPIGLAN